MSFHHRQCYYDSKLFVLCGKLRAKWVIILKAFATTSIITSRSRVCVATCTHSYENFLPNIVNLQDSTITSRKHRFSCWVDVALHISEIVTSSWMDNINRERALPSKNSREWRALQSFSHVSRECRATRLLRNSGLRFGSSVNIAFSWSQPMRINTCFVSISNNSRLANRYVPETVFRGHLKDCAA